MDTVRKDAAPLMERNKVSRGDAEDAIRTLLRWAGEDPAREGLLDTPKRVVDAYTDWFSGYAIDPARLPAPHVRGNRGL